MTKIRSDEYLMAIAAIALCAGIAMAAASHLASRDPASTSARAAQNLVTPDCLPPRAAVAKQCKAVQ